MNTRVNILQTQPEAYKAMMGLEKYIASTNLDSIHKELIKLRASQINGCAFCLDMHSKDARKMGMTEQKIYLLNAWSEVKNLYSEEERIILKMTEEVTLIQNQLSDETYNKAIALFGEAYVATLIMMIVTINAWNRIAISTEMQPA